MAACLQTARRRPYGRTWDLVERLKGLGLTGIEETSDGFIARDRPESSAR